MKDVNKRLDIISARVQGVSHERESELEDLEWIDSQEVECGAIVIVRGDQDLIAGLTADMIAKNQYETCLGDDKYALIEIPEI
jgi:hypothetical protein